MSIQLYFAYFVSSAVLRRFYSASDIVLLAKYGVRIPQTGWFEVGVDCSGPDICDSCYGTRGFASSAGLKPPCRVEVAQGYHEREVKLFASHGITIPHTGIFIPGEHCRGVNPRKDAVCSQTCMGMVGITNFPRLYLPCSPFLL